jgi:molecular chaperone DnaK
LRETIDYGIYLGTTKSAIAKINGVDVEVFKNNEGFEFTPSAVWMDSKGRLNVGRRAKERLEDDSENAYSEFKLQMGSSNKYLFSRSGIWMTPEQLSSEVLKSLKADVKIHNGEDVTSAVITVPAAFDLPQNKATHSAAELAGITTCLLLQEPVAAAMAYSFQTKKDNVFWLVYDFGGGTFDAAIIQVKDGLIEVVNHSGDNHLGGKLLDWEIVNELFVPAITKEYKLNNFRRDNPNYRGAFAKLKSQAEQAKIRLSREESVEINVEYLGKNENGDPLEFIYELRKSDFERLARPLIIRSINICKKVLVDKRLGVGDIEKVLMVGGTSLIPSLREMLLDTNEGLGIELDSSIYPITVVAQGAAIYAGTQRMPKIERVIKSDEYFLDLEYSPVGSDLEPPVGGKITADIEKDYTGFTIEFINRDLDPEWRSGKYLLKTEGNFFTQLFAEKGKKNIFQIELLNPPGIKQKTIPETISYTPGIVNDSIPLTHSIGIALDNNETEVFFEKGTLLTSTPARCRKIWHIDFEIRVGHEEDEFRLPFVEGERKNRADRNRLIGFITINGSQIKHSIPVGSEIEITLEIDRSRLIRAKAYIPIIDEEIEEVLDLGKTKFSKDKLVSDFDYEKKRLEEIKKKASVTSCLDTNEVLKKIENEKMLIEIETSINSFEKDPVAGDKAENRLLDLQIAIDRAEEALEWPLALKTADDILESVNAIISNPDTNQFIKDKIYNYGNELRMAIQSKDLDLLKKKIQQLKKL